jgi:hypothetical protein
MLRTYPNPSAPARPPPPGGSSADRFVTAAPAAADGGGGSPSQRQQQQQEQQQADGGGDSRAQFAVSAAAKERVRTQQLLQDELAEDMLGLTAEMKAGAMAMQNAIRYRWVASEAGGVRVARARRLAALAGHTLGGHSSSCCA